ncbi:MAG: pseudouridine-5'-phosphate glycosidase [Peptostreptococcales bacterium]
MVNSEYLDLSLEVQEAMESNKPIVALESTIIAHGMPYPDNVEMARRVSDIVREKGCVPATIGIVNGRMKVGMTDEDIEYFAKAKDVLKVSRRDISYAISKKLNGATTVAGTMIIANMAGIDVFVTGGIGGVHRGASESFDISADLLELAQTDVAVVCAGAKSILDIGATLEYLETNGVAVLGYRTDEFPAFYTRKSGFGVDYVMDSAQEAADFIYTKKQLELKGGTVIGCPIPEEHELNPEEIEKVIHDAVKKASALHITGKKVTPFLLSEIKEITEGSSLKANLELVYNNARIGSEIARLLKQKET